MGNVTVGFDGDASQIVREYERLISKQGDIIAKLKSTKDVSKEAGKEIDRAFGRRAQKVLKDLETPFDKYLKKRKDIRRMVKEGLLDPKQAKRATDAVKTLYRTTTTGAKESAEANRIAAEEMKRLGEKARSIYEVAKTSQQKYTNEVELLTKAYNKGELSLNQYNQSIDHTAKKYETARKKGGFAFGPAMLSDIGKLTGALGMGGGLASVVALVTDQYKNLQKVQLEAFQMQRRFASEEELTNVNLGNVSPSERTTLVEGIDKLSGDADVSKSSIHRRLRSALSRRSAGMTIDDMLGAVRSSYLHTRYDDESGSGAAGFAVTMKPHGYTSDQAVGLFAAGLTQASIDNPKQFAEYFSKSMTRSKQAKLADNKSAALFGAVSTALGDTSGADTKTALGTFYAALDKYKLSGKSIPGDTTAKKMNWLIQNPKAGAKFADTAPLGQAAPTFKELLTGGKTQQDFIKYTKALPKKDDLDEYLHRMAEEKGDTKAMHTARTGDFLDERNRVMLEAVPQQLGELAMYRDKYEEIAKRSGMLGLDIKAQKAWAWMKGNDADDTVDMFRVAQQNFANKAHGYGARQRPNGTWTQGYGEAAATPLQRQQAVGELAETTKIIERLEKLGDAIEQSNAILERQEALLQRQEDLQGQQVINTTKSPIRDNSDKE